MDSWPAPFFLQRTPDWNKLLATVQRIASSELSPEMDHVRFIYESSRAEGSTVSFEETECIVNEIKRDRSYSSDVESCKDVIGHYKAVEFMLKYADVDVSVVKRVHMRLVGGSSPSEFRTHPSCVSGTGAREMQYLAPELIERSLTELIDDTDHQIKGHVLRISLPIVTPETIITPELFRIAAKFMIEFLRIHPFSDGNGRMARILVNRWLSLCWIFALVPFVSGLRKRAKNHYMEMLHRCQTGRASVDAMAAYILVMVYEELTGTRADE